MIEDEEIGEQPTLVVSEVFGPTFQGEGPSAGRRAGFVRLMGCNLSCYWCDSAYTWDGQRYNLKVEGKRMTPKVIARAVARGGPEIGVITGGEPLLHQSQKAWVPLLKELVRCGLQIEIETNGTQMPTDKTIDRVTRFNVSPKLEHAGDSLKDRFKPNVLRTLAGTGCAVFKFVVTGLEDLSEIRGLIDGAGIPNELVWIMPEGTDGQTLNDRLSEIAQAVVDRGWNLTSRLHVHAYGDRRGV